MACVLGRCSGGSTDAGSVNRHAITLDCGPGRRRDYCATDCLPAQRLTSHDNVFSPKEPFVCSTSGQVFWLPDQTKLCTFPRQVSSGRSFSDRLELHAVAIAKFVPGYSGGTATDSHRLPYSSPRQQAVRDTQVCVRSRHARDGFEHHHRNARRKDFNHVPERFRESTAPSQFTQFRVFKRIARRLSFERCATID